MSSFGEPTQRIRRPNPPAAPLPGSLDPLRGRDPAPDAENGVETGTGWVDIIETEPVAEKPAEPGATGVLALDEIFDGQSQAAAARTSTAATEAPTWTAMPVVPVRSEPLPTAGPPVPLADPHQYDEDRDHRPGARDDMADAFADTRARFEAWLRRDDNGLMLLTAVIACVLMIVVAGVHS